MDTLPVPILIPVWAARDGWPQRGAWLGLGTGQEVFVQGPQYLGKVPWQRAGLPSPPTWVQERDAVQKGVQACGSQSPWLKWHTSPIGSARPGFLCVCGMSPHPAK